MKSKVCVCREYWRGVILLLAISLWVASVFTFHSCFFFLFLPFGLTTRGSLLFSSTMINSGGFVCLNYRAIHIHSFSLLLLHGLFPFRVRVGPFILVKDLIKITSLYWPMRQHQDSQTLRLEWGWYTVTSFTRKVPFWWESWWCCIGKYMTILLNLLLHTKHVQRALQFDQRWSVS